MNEAILQISPSISRQYMIKGSDGYLLIDTGLHSNYRNLSNFLHSANLDFYSIEMVIITHADGDHFGCLDNLLQANPRIVTCASEIEAKAITAGKSSRPLRSKGLKKALLAITMPLFTSPPVEIKRILTPGEEFPFLGGLEVLDTKGHTPGHISLWSKSTHTLFSGDSIRIHGNVLSPSAGSNTWDEQAAKKSFELQLELKPDRIFGGHGVWTR